MKPWNVVDLFSGAGGMSYGFHARPEFRIIGAVDVQAGKPSSGHGTLECNSSYQANMGLAPYAADLAEIAPSELAERFGVTESNPVTILSSCAPCTGFSRALNQNHSRDDARNSLVGRSALFVRELRPAIFLMENARELIRGNFSHHYCRLANDLRELGYEVHGGVHLLNRFGLPQLRERAVVVAVRRGLRLQTLDDLWDGLEVRPEATHVRGAISGLPEIEAGRPNPDDPLHIAPALGETNLARIKRIPKDGGSWGDLRHDRDRDAILTPAMRRYVEQNDFGSHPDVYGRMAWDKPAPTIKRECGHVGNGRYAHPDQDRLCSVRELAILQGFPKTYQFVSNSLTNKYRHIGDAVPPLVSFQLSALCAWILTGRRPSVDEMLLKDTHLTAAAFAARGSWRTLFD